MDKHIVRITYTVCLVWKMTSIVSDVVNAIQKMLADLKSIMESALSRMATVGEKGASDIRTFSMEAFTTVRTRITTALHSTENYLKSLRFDAGHAGSEVMTFRDKVESMMRTLVHDMQILFDRFKDSMTLLLTYSKDALSDVEKDIAPVAKDVTGDVEKATSDFLAVIKDVASDAASKMLVVLHDIEHVVMLPADFAYSHGLQIAEASALTVVQPAVIVSFALAGGLLYLGSTYSPPED